MLISEKGVAVVSAILATGLCMIYPLWAVFGVVTAILLFSNVCLLIWEIPLGLHCTFLIIMNTNLDPRIVWSILLMYCHSHRVLSSWFHVLRDSDIIPLGQHNHAR